MTGRDTNRIVSEIVSDIAGHAPYRQFAGEIGPEFADAYRRQNEVVDALLSRNPGGGVCGYKIALNSRAGQERYGLSEPISGCLLAAQKRVSPASLATGDYHTFLIELEIAALLGRALPPRPAGHDRRSVIGAIERFVPAFELIDTRGAHLPDLDIASAIAQNITNEGLVVGGPGCAPGDLEVETLPVVLTVDDVPVVELVGAAPQHPLDAVAWLADHLPARGRRLEAGMIVLCGSHVPPGPVAMPSRVRMRMGDLGEAAFTIE